MKILLVDDDKQLIQLIQNKLKQDHYVVEIAKSGEYALNLMREDSYDLLLLDVVLPDMSGFDVCRALRSQGHRMPILILTGKDQTSDKVAGLDAGADDYLVKPFELDELAARVRALLRRDAEAATPTFSYGALVFDPVSRRLTYEGQLVELRPKELAIMELMLRYPTHIFDPDTLLDRLWTLSDCPGKATIKAHIRSLRQRLSAAGADNIIETLYGQGYRLNPSYAEISDLNKTLQSDKLSPVLPSQEVIHQTWQQVQSLTWNRLTRLRDLLLDSPNVQNIAKAAELAHQLKGTLGTFGFEQASEQAKLIESRLSESGPVEAQVIAKIQVQVEMLLQNLRQQTKSHPLTANLLSTEKIPVLVVFHDCIWAEQLRQISQDFPFHISCCSPLNVMNYLIEQIPHVIVIELVPTESQMNSSLLDVLSGNYSGQTPILAVIDDANPELASLAMQKGASTILSKSWSLRTLLMVISEYLAVPERNQCR